MKGIQPVVVILLSSIIVIGLIFGSIGSITSASFSDTEQSTENTFIAWIEESFKYLIAYAEYAGGFFLPCLKTAEIAIDGSIADTVIDSLTFDPDWGRYLSAIHIYGDIYAIAYNGYPDQGILKTFDIDTNGNITDTAIDTLVFDSSGVEYPHIIPISGDIYAIAYTGDPDDGFLTTVEIANDGQITDTIIDTLEFDTSAGITPNIIHVSGDIYAIAYQGKGDDGFLKTVEISTNGQITDTIIDELEFDTTFAGNPTVIPVSGDVYVIAYCGDLDGDGFVKTVEIASNGQITDAVIDTLEYNGTMYEYIEIIHISGDVYAIVYDGYVAYGFIETLEIAANGQITDTAIDTMQFDNSYVTSPDIIPVSGDVFAIAFQGNSGDGYLKTVEITTNGQITDTIIDELEFDTNHCAWPDMVQLSGN